MPIRGNYHVVPPHWTMKGVDLEILETELPGHLVTFRAPWILCDKIFSSNFSRCDLTVD